ncbi:hypothetical protein N9164_15125, partial [Draconibacterium sp.]|nr:hypothetical protein [Draconibacterium sp.]
GPGNIVYSPSLENQLKASASDSKPPQDNAKENTCVGYRCFKVRVQTLHYCLAQSKPHDYKPGT